VGAAGERTGWRSGGTLKVVVVRKHFAVNKRLKVKVGVGGSPFESFVPLMSCVWLAAAGQGRTPSAEIL
jgi:hypothetical protein